MSSTLYSAEGERKVIGVLPYGFSSKGQHVLAVLDMLPLRHQLESVGFDFLDHTRLIETNVLHGPAIRHGAGSLIVFDDHQPATRLEPLGDSGQHLFGVIVMMIGIERECDVHCA